MALLLIYRKNYNEVAGIISMVILSEAKDLFSLRGVPAIVSKLFFANTQKSITTTKK
jgi:hypothetical protein